LGWLFVAKARTSFDPGYYKLAEHCALVLERAQPKAAAAWLLRGHALHSQHRFQEAEVLARALVNQRGLAFDFGLLGDVLVDVGQVDQAARAYQSMLDLKPDPFGYARAGHIRWLKGDLDGALEVMQMAARGSSPRDPESAAWIHTQLGRYLWQAQATNEARLVWGTALTFHPDYAPAQLWRARMLLSEGAAADAIPLLRRAGRDNPLPEYGWALAEALRAARQDQEAASVEEDLIRRGPSTDPRTCSLFLATKGLRVEIAVRLAEQELEERADVFTHDALAWALAAAGRFEPARNHMNQALAAGTCDARLYFHAAVIAEGVGQVEEARSWLTKAAALAPMLLPSEQARLQAIAGRLGQPLPALRADAHAAPASAAKSFPSDNSNPSPGGS
jgi:tetratricopeptide (TPR) repeat protein